jgi:hypothetical protein
MTSTTTSNDTNWDDREDREEAAYRDELIAKARLLGLEVFTTGALFIRAPAGMRFVGNKRAYMTAAEFASYRLTLKAFNMGFEDWDRPDFVVKDVT